MRKHIPEQARKLLTESKDIKCIRNWSNWIQLSKNESNGNKVADICEKFKLDLNITCDYAHIMNK